MNTNSKADFIKMFSSKDRLGHLLGAKLILLSKEECIFEYKVNPEHFNPNGILHGGALFSVMDSSQGAFLHFILDDSYKFAATGTATIKFLAPVLDGTLRIRTWLKGTERRKFFVNSTAQNESGIEIATLEEIWVAALA